MRFWVDGSSLHATERCLRQVASPEQASDLLHTAIQLVFAEKLVIGRFGGGIYAERSVEVQRRLESIGFPADMVRIEPTSPWTLDQIYVAAGDACAAKLKRVHDASLAQKYTNLTSAQAETEKRFDTELRKIHSAKDREDLYEEVKDLQNNGHLIMLAKSDAFYDAVKRLVSDTKEWSAGASAQLATACRMSIHLESASRYAAVYAPSRERGLALRKLRLPAKPVLGEQKRFSEEAWNSLSEMVEESLGLKTQQAGLPSIANVLASRSQGDPHRLLDHALALRDKMGPLRHQLRVICESAGKGDAKSLANARRKMLAMRKAYEEYLDQPHPKRSAGALVLVGAAGTLYGLFGAASPEASAMAFAATAGAAVVPVLEKISDEIASFNRYQKFYLLGEMVAEAKRHEIDIEAVALLGEGVSAKA